MKITIVILTILFEIVTASIYAQVEPSYKNARVVNLGKDFNSPQMDYAPCVSYDGTMFFVSDRSGSQMTKEGTPSHDILMALRKMNQDTLFFQPFNPDPPQNKGKLGLNTYLNEGAASISLDKKRLYFTGCNRGYGMGDCDIYVANIAFRDDTIIIEGVFNLGWNINTSFWESQPSISPDNKRLYFASSRQSTIENTVFDIWYSDFDTEANKWMPARPLPKEINTSDIENSPYIAPDNKTLFFASDGHSPNYGKTDFYYSRLDSNGKWSKPTNLGIPINTNDSEQFICSSITGNTLYISSTRTDIPGNQGNLDVYAVTIPNILEEVNLVSWQQADDGEVEISIDNDSETIRTFSMGQMMSGRHSFVWEGRDKNKNRVPSGKYYYEVKVNGVQDTQGILLMK